MGKNFENKAKQTEKSSKSELKAGASWGTRHLQAACMCVCMTGLVIVRSSMGVAVLAMTDHSRENTTIRVYDWDKKTQGLVLSSFFWGYVVMQVPAGVLAKKFGGKPIFLFALLANAVICLLVPFLASVGSWPLVCGARVVTGLTQACTFPATHTLLGRWVPDQERVFMTSFVYGGLQLGTILGMPISGLLAATAAGWPVIFYSTSALMLFVAVMWHWLSASSPAQHPLISNAEREYIERGLSTSDNGKQVRTPWRQILTARPIWAITAAHIGVAYVFVLFFVDTPTFLEKGLRLSLRNSAVFSALPYIGQWVGSFLSGAICEKVYNKGLLSATGCRKVFNSIGAVGSTAGLIGLSFVSPDSTILGMVWLMTAVSFTGFYMSGFLVNSLDLSPNFAGVLMSFTSFFANFGSIAAPIGTSFILRNDPTDLTRWRIVFLIAAGWCVASNIVYVSLGTSERQPWDDPNFMDKKEADLEEMKPAMSPDPELELAKEKQNEADL